eukprot:comp23520_c0_seq1/m.39511 comp23520_c0_seq1/g.39511  ORF comp23520_c0_seq1/g.39511 comp23520_c0_seq1/m.39511 type:complete len:150 (+) comp23520_c0_seq1:928-1377(+)
MGLLNRSFAAEVRGVTACAKFGWFPPEFSWDFSFNLGVETLLPLISYLPRSGSSVLPFEISEIETELFDCSPPEDPSREVFPTVDTDETDVEEDDSEMDPPKSCPGGFSPDSSSNFSFLVIRLCLTADLGDERGVDQKEKWLAVIGVGV